MSRTRVQDSKMEGELLALTYGAIVARVMKDTERCEEANIQVRENLYTPGAPFLAVFFTFCFCDFFDKKKSPKSISARVKSSYLIGRDQQMDDSFDEFGVRIRTKSCFLKTESSLRITSEFTNES